MKSFLTTRTAKEAYPVLLKLFREEKWVRLKVAERLGVDYTTLWRWFRLNPEYAVAIDKKRAEFMAQEID